MSQISWNEIKSRAVTFSKRWADEVSEDAEAKTFIDDFFNVFGVERKRVASFEQKVKKIDGKDGFIDMLWKGTLLIEMKSRGKDLNKAFTQAKDYFPGIKDSELPKYILVCDFEKFRLYDFEGTSPEPIEFTLDKLIDNIQHFGFIAGYQKRTFKDEDPVNIKAAELMGKLHDELKASGYDGHQLEVFLVRLLFCLFADDTSIFEKGIFYDYINTKTNEDGSDLGMHLAQLFQVLNQPESKRQKSLDEALAAFPYINGKLFEEKLTIAAFNSSMRNALLNAAVLDWGKISPAIFGSLFQSVLDPTQRRNLGAHYTSEKNILKVIKPLFLDELYQEFEQVKSNKKKVEAFHDKLSKLKFLDPACGCGNFLIIAYRELRLLEIEVVKKQLGKQLVNVNEYLKVDVDQFYGIEIDEFPSQIAQVAMWLTDHQMNMRASDEFGEYYIRLPLTKSATIVNANALRIDWKQVVPDADFIFGNPPFVGKKEQNFVQKSDMEYVLTNTKGAGVLDYVTAWYIVAARYIQNTKTKVAYVSTNSISQGEQVGLLWTVLFNKYNIKIHFAHRTFSWRNEARGNAAVHCVIVGFANYDVNVKSIFEYEDIKAEPHEIKVKNINPFLVEGKDVTVENRKSPICKVALMNYGSFALDDGNYTLTEAERNDIVSENKSSEKLIKPYIGGRELLHSEKRYCLWLEGAQPNEIKSNYKVKERVEAVKKWRINSDRGNTRKLAETPTLFAEVRQPKTDYLAFPTVSSVNRKYIPIAFLTPNVVASNQLYVLPHATLYHFGVLTSFIHMSWVKYICGRLKSDFRYSAGIVYNNYPWPETVNDKQREQVEQCAQAVLDARAKYPTSSLADLYDPLTMPPDLVKAHNALDKAVDQCYRKEPFTTESQRIAYLFELYERYTATLFTEEKPKKKKKT
ncbi:MAG: class I SAM-dependent DNA methyltransferase [Candidatus Kapabacteria bacterium]|nr:class I SAM-dependent DNA methyltransferase [Candidatus Kapabacteria bacterium]